MKKNSDVRKKIENSFFTQLLICIGLLVIIWATFYIAHVGIGKKNDLRHLRADEYDFVFQIDSVKDNGKEVYIEGWAFKLNADSEEGDLEILLYDIEKDEIVYPRVECRTRDDVNQYFFCEYDYSRSGFIASIGSKELELENKSYKVLFKSREKKRIYMTDTYISNEGVVYANPSDFRELEVAGTDLEKVVKEGILRVYRPELGMYLYQYDGKMYWIAGETYNFESDGKTKMVLHWNTNQYAKLPENRIQHKFENQDFYFEQKELTIGVFGNYRVVCFEIPQKYAVTKVVTGQHKDEWIWKQEFRLWYDIGTNK